MAFLSLTHNSGSTNNRIADGTDALRNIDVNSVSRIADGTNVLRNIDRVVKSSADG